MVVIGKTRALKVVQFFPFLLISLDKIIMYEKSGFGPSGSQCTLVSRNRENSREVICLTLGSKYEKIQYRLLSL